ncbi:hypothetical protein [Rhizobium sp. P38BS-XIX]|uniref:hypothetical protein n=1 Tax=Rhizobium sp. P38BS-XIX TaxID=2726740 RepID=UPI0032B212EC
MCSLRRPCIGPSASSGANTQSKPNFWISDAFLTHDDKSKKDSTSKWGSFGMVNMGVDYLLSEKALVGLSFHYDRMTDPTDQDAELTGNGWLAGPYASLELGKGVFWNGSLGAHAASPPSSRCRPRTSECSIQASYPTSGRRKEIPPPRRPRRKRPREPNVRSTRVQLAARILALPKMMLFDAYRSLREYLTSRVKTFRPLP